MDYSAGGSAKNKVPRELPYKGLEDASFQSSCRPYFVLRQQGNQEKEGERKKGGFERFFLTSPAEQMRDWRGHALEV